MVTIIDQTDFIQTIKRLIAKWSTGIETDNYRLKPFDCSLCATWWGCLLFLIINGNFSIFYITISGLLAIFTPIINEILVTIKYGTIWLISRMKKW